MQSDYKPKTITAMAPTSWMLLILSRSITTFIALLHYLVNRRFESLQSKLSRDLQCKGYIIIRNFLDDSLVAELAKNCREIMASKKQSNSAPQNTFTSYEDLALQANYMDIRGSDSKKDLGMIDIFNPVLNPSLAELLQNKFKKHRIFRIIKSSQLPWEPRVQPSCTNLYYYNSVSSPRSLHFDSLLPHYKCFIALQDITSADQGPYSVIPYSHRLLFYHRLMAFVCKVLGCDYTDAIFYPKHWALKFFLNSGDLLVGDQRCIHGDTPAGLGGEKTVFVKCYTYFP